MLNNVITTLLFMLTSSSLWLERELKASIYFMYNHDAVNLTSCYSLCCSVRHLYLIRGGGGKKIKVWHCTSFECATLLATMSKTLIDVWSHCLALRGAPPLCKLNVRAYRYRLTTLVKGWAGLLSLKAFRTSMPLRGTVVEPTSFPAHLEATHAQQLLFSF